VYWLPKTSLQMMDLIKVTSFRL